MPASRLPPCGLASPPLYNCRASAPASATGTGHRRTLSGALSWQRRSAARRPGVELSQRRCLHRRLDVVARPRSCRVSSSILPEALEEQAQRQLGLVAGSHCLGDCGSLTEDLEGRRERMAAHRSLGRIRQAVEPMIDVISCTVSLSPSRRGRLVGWWRRQDQRVDQGHGGKKAVWERGRSGSAWVWGGDPRWNWSRRTGRKPDDCWSADWTPSSGAAGATFGAACCAGAGEEELGMELRLDGSGTRRVMERRWPELGGRAARRASQRRS